MTTRAQAIEAALRELVDIERLHKRAGAISPVEPGVRERGADGRMA